MPLLERVGLAEGRTMFLATRDMATADQLCDRVAFVVDDTIAALASPPNDPLVSIGILGVVSRRMFDRHIVASQGKRSNGLLRPQRPAQHPP
ncbi:hypothetical protein [Nocardia flavorosea]|uniref:hypothetical protein n=1 Tax=Nocardia flavorosea TaxID=53429 RepID=UPI0007A54257